MSSLRKGSNPLNAGQTIFQQLPAPAVSLTLMADGVDYAYEWELDASDGLVMRLAPILPRITRTPEQQAQALLLGLPLEALIRLADKAMELARTHSDTNPAIKAP